MTNPGWLERLGYESGPLVIGEIAQAHDGSLGMALSLVEVIAASGAQAVKFQTHLAAYESSPAEPWRVKFSHQDETRYEYWQRMEFRASDWKVLVDRAHDLGLLVVDSVFCPEAIELMEPLGVDIWKVASGEVTSLDLIDRLVATGRPVVMSSGMSTWAELDQAIERVPEDARAVLQCTSEYPVRPERLGLNLIGELSDRYGCPVGFSDHSAAVASSLGAVALGARLIEVHVAFHRQIFGPDTPAALTPEQLAELVDGARLLSTALAHPVDKDDMARDLAPMRAIFSKSVVVIKPLAEREVITKEHLGLRKPGTGLDASALGGLIGRMTCREVEPGTVLSEEDLLPTVQRDRDWGSDR